MAYSVIDLQGNILISGTTLYTVPIGRSGNIDNIKINNPDNTSYQISLYKVISTVPILLYTFNLDAGDIISDSNHYVLNSETSLYGISNNDNVTFTLNGSEIDIDNGSL